mgnify:CR=1 FL=1
MKKIFLFATMFAVSLSMLAQEYMHVWQDGKKTDYVVTEVDSVTFNKMMHNGHEYVDLGLPSGTLWKRQNESGFYTYEEALNAMESEIHKWLTDLGIDMSDFPDALGPW